MEAFLEACRKRDALTWNEPEEFIDRIYQEFTDPQIKIKDLVEEGQKHAVGKDPGVLLAAEMGYDAINAEGHGMSGSYTVILNRTKVIFKESGVTHEV